MHKKSRFARGGCFKCENCGKLTRDVESNYPFCPKCNELMQHENYHADTDLENDDCGDPNCPVKDYPEEKKWWKK